jgi:tetratricopeptide (TPR) repeat protein
VNRFEELVQLGKQLRDRGDMSSAITKFKEAATNDAKSPIPLNELASTYDKMGLADKAAENWRKIYEMGDSAGIYYQVAEAKLKASQQRELRNVERATPAPETPVDNSGAIDGIAAGATLGLLQVTTEEQQDANSAKHFTLHIPIKSRPKAHIDVKDLVLHILFYDIVDGQNVVQTSANVNFRWATPPADWVDSDTEELTVEYQLPKPEARAAKKENRKYFGYIVRIYYKQQLQVATAEPERLAQQYPAPPTLPKESDKQ